MPLNNSALYDSVVSAIAASNGAWLTDPISGDYGPQANAAVAIALEVDSLIAPILTGATLSQRVLLDSIVKSVMAGRSPTSTLPFDYLRIGQAIAAAFIEFSTRLQNTDTGIPGPPLATTAPVNVTKSTAQIGSLGTSAHADHKHDIDTGVPTAVVPGDSAQEGAGTALARASHQHSIAGFGMPGAIVPGDTAATGSAATFACSDHRHSIAGFATPTSITPGDTPYVGIASTFANSQHRHGIPGFGIPGSIVPGDSAATGIATTFACSDHKHSIAGFAIPGAITPGDTALVGLASTFANSAHQHSIPGFGMPGSVVPGDSAAIGVATTFACSDHKHAVAAFAIPVSVGLINSAGVLTTFARSDHIHAIDPTATSRVAFAPGTRNVIIYTTPASPTGNGRFILTRCIVRLGVSLLGTGNVTISVGSTSGGTQIILPVNINSATVQNVLAGEAVATLGANMTVVNAYEAVYSAGQDIYVNVLVTGLVTSGAVDIYIWGLWLTS
jgi:hypothetical protein